MKVWSLSLWKKINPSMSSKSFGISDSKALHILRIFLGFCRSKVWLFKVDVKGLQKFKRLKREKCDDFNIHSRLAVWLSRVAREGDRPKPKRAAGLPEAAAWPPGHLGNPKEKLVQFGVSVGCRKCLNNSISAVSRDDSVTETHSQFY